MGDHSSLLRASLDRFKVQAIDTYAQDIARMHKVLGAQGFCAADLDLEMAWRLYSQGMGEDWTKLPSKDDALFLELMHYFHHGELTDRDDPVCLVNSTDARAVADAHGGRLNAVVIFAVRDDGVIDTATWGETRFHKDAIAAWAHGLARNTVTQVPFKTVFGVGNAGRPQRLSDGALESLSPGFREYVEAWTAPDADAPSDES